VDALKLFQIVRSLVNEGIFYIHNISLSLSLHGTDILHLQPPIKTPQIKSRAVSQCMSQTIAQTMFFILIFIYTYIDQQNYCISKFGKSMFNNPYVLRLTFPL